MLAWTRSEKRRRRQGMTLIELILVVALVALASTGVSFAFAAVTRSQLRSACLKVIAASRFAYNRAIVKGVTVRIVLDFEEDTISIEESSSARILLSRDADGEGGGVVDPWEAAQQSVEGTLAPRGAESPFHVISTESGEAISRYKPQKLGANIELRKLIATHLPAATSAGQNAIYYFPGGISEYAVLQLTDGSDDVYTVELHPWTGKGKVYARPFEGTSHSESALGLGSEVRDDG